MTRYFITVDWCNKGFRGVFCNRHGATPGKDDEPHTTEEMDDFLGLFTLILRPQSQEMSEADLAQHTRFVPLAEYSHEWGIALTVEDHERWWEAVKESAREVNGERL